MQTAFPLPEQAAPSASSRAPRLTWIDNLRTFIILLVVNMHACVTYSHVGSWYITEEPEPPMPVKMTFLFWQGHLQAFFMGLSSLFPECLRRNRSNGAAHLTSFVNARFGFACPRSFTCW